MATLNHPRAPLNTREAAEYLGCSESWLRQTRMGGTDKVGPAYYRNGKSVRYTIEDLEAFRNANRSDRAVA